MVDIQTISIAIASAGVFVAAVYYILQLRHQKRVRQTDLLMRLHLATSSRESAEAFLEFKSIEYKDYDDFVKKYGSPYSKGQIQTALLMISQLYEGIGVLLKNKLADIDLVTELFGIESFWMKVKPLAEGMRKQTNDPRLFQWGEYFYNEMKKREQQLPQKGI